MKTHLVLTALLTLLPMMAGAEPGPVFNSPEAAKAALMSAIGSRDKGAILNVVGDDAKDIVNSGDPTYDDFILGRITKEAAQLCDIERWDGDTIYFDIGPDAWQLPIPLKRKDGGWRFDPSDGKRQILQNRIRRNEATAGVVGRTFANAQLLYAEAIRAGNTVKTYARRFISTPGTQDGLYWPKTTATDDASPLAPLIEKARKEGYPEGEFGAETPYHGYHYRVLTAQGANAPGGARDYMSDGKLIHGFALVSWPAKWGDSGVNTFLVHWNGQVWKKDLGAQTASLVKEITSYNPDSSWQLASQ